MRIQDSEFVNKFHDIIHYLSMRTEGVGTLELARWAIKLMPYYRKENASSWSITYADGHIRKVRMVFRTPRG